MVAVSSDPYSAYGRSAGGNAPPIDFVTIAPKVAEKLFGSPNKRLSTKSELRFGTHGSMKVSLEDATFYDFERKIGGGLLDMIQQAHGCDAAGALSWLEDEGLKDREARAASTTSFGPIFYDYRDEKGTILFRVRRSPDKRFIQLGPDGNGGFHAAKGCMEGVRRVPYRLPEILSAPASQLIFVCEGEKDADRLVSLGLLATCNSEGAGKFRTELVPHFAGRRVVIIPDNDAVGENHAIDVATKLKGAASAVGILRLPGLAAKGADVSDWLDAGGTIAQLNGLACAGLEKPVDAASDGPSGCPVKATPYVWRDPTTIPPRDWIYGRSILRGHLRAVVAQGGAGKTTLSIGEALAMVTGRDFLGQNVPGGPKRVWIWNLEDDGEELSRAIQAACKHWRITPTDLDGRLFVDSALDGAILKLAEATVSDGFRINRPLIDALVKEMTARRIDYLHVDPFVSSHAANENDNMQIDAIAKEWALVAKRANAAVGLAHHVSKAGAGEATALSARGAGSLINACRSVLTLNRMGDDEAKRFGIEDERRRRFFRVYDDKNNRAPPSDKSDWFQLFSVDLGNGPDGHGDSIGVAVPWSPPDAFDGVTPAHLYRVQKAIESGRYRESSQASDWVGKAVADVLGLDLDSKSDRARINALLRTWYGNDALVIVDGRDDRRKPVKFVGVGNWAVDGLAPPRPSGAEQSGAGGAPKALRSTSPPIGEVGGAAGAAGKIKVEQNWGGAALFPHGNPALCPSRNGMILAPGESPEDPVPGWEDL